MEISDLNFIPHSDSGADEIDEIEQHDNLIKSENFDEATSLLDNENFEKGVRASLLNSIQNKIRKLQLYLLNEFVAENDEYFSDTEPDTTFMQENGYTHWIQPW